MKIWWFFALLRDQFSSTFSETCFIGCLHHSKHDGGDHFSIQGSKKKCCAKGTAFLGAFLCAKIAQKTKNALKCQMCQNLPKLLGYLLIKGLRHEETPQKAFLTSPSSFSWSKLEFLHGIF